VSWRAHPNYRAEVCFDNATRANLGGLKHAERVFLGLALMYRYTNKRSGTRFDDMATLVPPKSQTEAEILGKAMRLGAMLWIRPDAQMAALDWQPKKKRLTLRLGSDAAPLYNEVAEARFQSLAGALGATGKVTVD